MSPLAPLLSLRDVPDLLATARAAADEALRHRALRRGAGPLAVEIGLRAAVASAALEGRAYELLAARDLVADDQLGRPQDNVDRLDLLCHIVTHPAGEPALLRAAVVHGELLAARPFPAANDVVARAAARLTLMAEGFDPRGLIAPELGHLAREPEYVGAALAFRTGTPDGLRAWLRHCATAVELAAAELRALAEAYASAA